MGLSILNNIPALEAENQLGITNTNLQNTLFQLSSGSKINSGADDPAGLSIADGLQANISALTQSAQNVTDGVGMLQTADGALSQVTTLLNRAVTLATEAGNAGLTQDQQNALQTEYASITAEINQIGSNTTYNDNQVFTSRQTSVFLSDGSSFDSVDPTISVTIPSLSSSSLGLDSYATGTLDLTGQPTAGNTVSVGSQTYTFVALGDASAANQVSLGTSVQATLQNLEDAVNGTGAAGVATYGVGTARNSSAEITAVNGGSATVQALQAGSAGNNIALSTSLTSNVGNSGGTTLTGGTGATYDTGTLTLNAQPGLLSVASGSLTLSALPDTITYATGELNLAAGQPSTAGTDTVLIGSQTYTFVASGDATSANLVALGTAAGATGINQTLTNLMNAVNGTGTSGATTYGASTAPVGTATMAVASGATEATITATSGGTAGNGVALSASGTIAGDVGPLGFLSGGAAADSVTIDGQAYTFVAPGQALLANQVAIVNSSNNTFAQNLNQTLTNLMDAVNNIGTGSINTYGANTQINPGALISSVTTVGNTAVATLEASNGAGSAQAGTSGNSVTLNVSSPVGALTPSGSTLSGGAAADTVTIGNVTYSFVAANQATSGNSIALGSNIQGTLNNLMAAVNATSTASGSASTYHITSVQGQGGAVGATITGDANGVAMVQALTSGVLANDFAFAANFAGGNATGTLGDLTNHTLSGGSSSTMATGMIELSAQPTTGNATGTISLGTNAAALGQSNTTVTINNSVYTFVIGNASAAGQVSVGASSATASIATALTNLENDINNPANNNNYHQPTVSLGGAVVASSINAATGSITLSATALGSSGNTNSIATSNGYVTGNGYLTGGGNSDTLNVDGLVYTFVAANAAVAGNEVALGTSTQATLANLQNAVNATSVGQGNMVPSSYHLTTGSLQTNQTAGGVQITAVNGGQAIVTAINGGTAGNAIVLTPNSASISAGSAGGGAAATNASGYLTLNANPSSGNTVTVGNQTYTFVSAAPTAANQVMIANTITQTLEYLADAVNGTAVYGGGAGSEYGTGTAQPNATMTVSGNQATVTASTAGTTGNSILLEANLSNGVGGGAVGTVNSQLQGGGYNVDLSNTQDAQNALPIIAAAISQVAATRGAIGSSINQMNAAVGVMNNTSQNLTSSLSGIQDANIGQVVANLSKYQILEQTGIAALAQANTNEQAVLHLLP